MIREYLRREIEAARKLLKYQKAYGIMESEVTQIEKNLAYYLGKWEGGGYDGIL